ncbi:MAG: NAD(P)H-dependent oxidoreductase [Gammaproteobacteria bacterium]|nr:NAD(P)H-dependent oxidoreductase [Gammaproteobacteria bacterium]
MNTTIAVIGSARRNGNTGKLIDWIADALGIEVIDLALKNISPFDYEHKNRGDDFLPLMDDLLKHDNIIFASPVYWFAMSSQMKIFIDRMSDFLSVEELKEQGRKLRGKVGYVVSTSISDKIDGSFLDSFTHTFDYLGLESGGFVHANCENGFNADDYQNDVVNFIESIKLSGK